MSLNETPSAERVTIGFFGKRNVGKSSVVNAVTGQDLAVVSSIKGTTTDPVQKTMELLPLGPVMIIDTPGIDDEGPLGQLRIEKTKKVLRKVDIALLVVDATTELASADEDLIRIFEAKGVAYIIVKNKSDLLPASVRTSKAMHEDSSPLQAGAGTCSEIYVSATTGDNINELKELIGTLAPEAEPEKQLIADLIKPNDIVVLVTPIDSAAPKGRLILPQQQTIRDILDSNAVSLVIQESELPETLSALAKKPRLVVTDSQAFKQVSADTPADIPLTSFSILFARYKGNLSQNVAALHSLNSLKEGDTVLICEGCTHHRQCDDIGTVKLPRWIGEHTGKQFEYEFTSGGDFPEDLSKYKLVVHCGGCMINEREMKYRLSQAEKQKVPMTNYGILIAAIQGILERSLEVFDKTPID